MEPQRKVVTQLGGWNFLLYNGKFPISRAYNYFIEDVPTVSWRNIMKRNFASPIALFITWLAIQISSPQKIASVNGRMTAQLSVFYTSMKRNR